MVGTTSEDVAAICARVENPQGSVAAVMRDVFALKGWGGEDAIDALAACMQSKASVLIKHEAAYCLGQMGDRRAVAKLTETLRDGNEDVIVRHEAAEALGAIGDPACIPVLEEFSSASEAREVYETCRLARKRIANLIDSANTRKNEAPADQTDSKTGADDAQPRYASVDPILNPISRDTSVPKLREMLCDSSLDLYERYEAMFALRNIGSDDAVLALAEGLRRDSESALFRHEVAFVLGQMQHVLSCAVLTERLRDADEHEMVRHECAEALGSIASSDAQAALATYASDASQIVRESVHVALDIADYNCASDSLHYTSTAT